jgi:hypothetical protein
VVGWPASPLGLITPGQNTPPGPIVSGSWGGGGGATEQFERGAEENIFSALLEIELVSL